MPLLRTERFWVLIDKPKTGMQRVKCKNPTDCTRKHLQVGQQGPLLPEILESLCQSMGPLCGSRQAEPLAGQSAHLRHPPGAGRKSIITPKATSP